MGKSICIRQRDASDCGPACLASVAAYFGSQIPVSRIRYHAGTDKRGSSLQGLIEAAEKLLFHAKGARSSMKSLKDVPFPAIFHLVPENGMQHFVVVYKIKNGGVTYMDPATGKMVNKPEKQFKRNWTGNILFLKPSGIFKKTNEKKSARHRFRHLIAPHKIMYIRTLAGATVYAVLGLATAVYIQKIIDHVLPEGNMNLANTLGIVMILLLCIRVLIGYFRSALILYTGVKIDRELVTGYYNHLLELPQAFFDHMRVGEIISRINDALYIRIFINDIALQVVIQTLALLLSITVMFFVSRELALMMLISIPVYIFIYLLSNRMNAKWERKIMEHGAALESHLVESMKGISTIRRFDIQKHFRLKTEEKFVQFRQAGFTSSRNSLRISCASEWVTGMATIAILWAGSYQVTNGKLSPGELLSFYTLTVLFTGPLQMLIGANKSMHDALIAADRLYEIIDLETEKAGWPSVVAGKFPYGDFYFDEIHFGFNSASPVFEGQCFRIARHHMTGIVGESGSGKSTLISLIHKFYLLQKGSIRIGERDIRDLATGLLRKEIAVVPQVSDIFQGTFISNIALGEEEPDLERVLDICERLDLHTYISSLPDRYETIIREQGMNLSGGQKQKIGIARALYRYPSVLIMDEATSAMDPETEARVQETIGWYNGLGNTVIIIAHRLSMISQCDNVVYLKKGQPADSGTHENLLCENLAYARLWQGNQSRHGRNL